VRPAERVYRSKLLQAISSIGIALGAAIGLAIALDPQGPPYLGGIVAVCAGYLSWLLGWQSAVRLRADGVVVDNMFIRSFVPWDSFREFRVRDGLRIVLTDGRVIGSLAFAGSLAGQLSGFRSLRRIVEQMETSRRELDTKAGQRLSEPGYGMSVAQRSTYRRGIHCDLWPLLALVVPLELIGLLTARLA
jgi:hypothetical protein